MSASDAGLSCFRRRAATALLLCLSLSTDPGEAQDVSYTEAAVKAAFLYHFGTYVAWPRQPGPDEALTIAVLDDVEVFEQLAQFLPGRSIEGRPVVARLVDSIDEIGMDEILYIGRTDNRRLDSLLAEVTSTPAPRLIVTDAPGGLRAGAAINFTLVGDRVRFEIDRGAARQSGLTLSARLLAAAYRVIGEA